MLKRIHRISAILVPKYEKLVGLKLGGLKLGGLRQFLTFFFMSFAALLVHYAVLIGLVDLFHVEPVTAALIGYSAGGVTSYILNRRYTFASTSSHSVLVVRFVVIAAIGFLLTFIFMNIFVNYCKLYYAISQLLTTGLVFFWSFGAHKWFTFAP